MAYFLCYCVCGLIMTQILEDSKIIHVKKYVNILFKFENRYYFFLRVYLWVIKAV